MKELRRFQIVKNVTFMLACFISAVFTFQIANSATYYVAPTGANSNSGMTIDSPWELQYAADRTNPGDTVYLLSGDYMINSDVNITRSGNAASYIVYSAALGNMPVFKTPTPCNAWNVLRVLANYIVIDGLELIGNNANITLTEGEANYMEKQHYLHWHGRSTGS